MFDVWRHFLQKRTHLPPRDGSNGVKPVTLPPGLEKRHFAPPEGFRGAISPEMARPAIEFLQCKTVSHLLVAEEITR
jgi:hypothetical protein